MSSHSNKSDFMQFLIEKCHFGNKKTKWACYWVERFEQLFPDWEQDPEHAIEAFNDLLCKRKSDIVINWALQADSASGRRCSLELFLSTVYEAGSRSYSAEASLTAHRKGISCMDPSISRFCVEKKACTRSKRQERQLYHHCGSPACVFELSCLGCTRKCGDTRAGPKWASCPVSHDFSYRYRRALECIEGKKAKKIAGST